MISEKLIIMSSLQRRADIFSDKIDTLIFHLDAMRKETTKFNENCKTAKNTGTFVTASAAIASTAAVIATNFAAVTAGVVGVFAGLLSNQIVNVINGAKSKKNIDTIKNLMDEIQVEVASMDSVIKYIVENTKSYNSELSPIECGNILERAADLRNNGGKIVVATEKNFTLLASSKQDQGSGLYSQAFVNATELFIFTDQKLKDNITLEDIDKIIKGMTGIKETYQKIFSQIK